MGDSNPFGGGGGRELVGYRKNAKAPDYQKFLDNYYRSFGGGPSGGGLNNAMFQESLSGFYGGQPFQDIATNLSKSNVFVPRSKPIYREEDSSIHPLGLF